jgi:hypothetical protein
MRDGGLGGTARSGRWKFQPDVGGADRPLGDGAAAAMAEAEVEAEIGR